MLDAVQEIAIYINRFHNLDLFQQGWYQIKITMRWEDDVNTSPGIPARVVQYEVPDMSGDDKYGVWRIDDTDNSFSTEPFRIKYARQDVLLSIMISFNLSLEKYQGPSTSAVILKFELMGTQTTNPVDSSDSKQMMLVKAFIVARDILQEELKKLSEEIEVIDLTDLNSNLNGTDGSPHHQEDVGTTGNEASSQGVPLNTIEKKKGIVDFQSDGSLQSLSEEDLSSRFHSLGNQVLYLWNLFLKVHRVNKTKILELLRDAWATDRRAEWSIWMVYSKVDMPHHYLSSGVVSVRGREKASILRKLNDDPAQTAAMRAELHRRSISQMRINNRSIQDMHIFEEPSHIPIILVERIVNAPFRTTSGCSYFRNSDHKDLSSSSRSGFKTVSKLSRDSFQKNGRILKIVVFVHGFQGHHLDLRLVRNQWLMIDPKVEFLMSEVNEEKTSGDFREMGLRLAQEVISFMKKKMDNASRSGTLKSIKLSFVGHSIGNVILRSALSESIMEPYLRYLYTYVSISGPHLGYLFSSNSLFNSGLWVMKKLKGTQCIHQLTLTDNPDLQKTFIYKLCKQKTLENFRNIILLSSPQDGYVPYHSARIELCQASSGDNSKRGKVFLEMLNDCLDQIRAPSHKHRVFMRCDVNFDISSSRGRNLNTIIGRAAHIEFLETDIFARFIMWSFPELFR